MAGKITAASQLDADDDADAGLYACRGEDNAAGMKTGGLLLRA